MDEQRYVVEITRPVPPDKVGQVAQRIAERLSVPHERIVTLLEGRVGAVTKPVLADKADAIAEVFAEAGVRVVVAAALMEPPQYEERFGEPPTQDASGDHGSEPEHDDVELEMGGDAHAYYAEQTAGAAEEPSPYEDSQVGEDRAGENRVVEDDDPPWSPDASWGFDEEAASGWTRRSAAEESGGGERDDEDEPYEPYEGEPYEDDPHADGFEDAPYEDEDEQDTDDQDADERHEDERQADEQYGSDRFEDEVPEEEADRLGPVPRRPSQGPFHPGGADSGPTDYAASTRWTPSPHDPYAFTPADSVGPDGRRPAPIGPARTTPLSSADEEGRAASQKGSDMGFFSPVDPQPREGPQLRVYLLWALAISLLVLILLQFVLALRVDGVEVVGAYGAGLAAFRKGEFGEARRIWEPVAEAGDPDAQYYLGFMVQNGLGQPWSNARAANWYRRAAQQGHASAQLALGDLYLRGLGVELDPVVGAAWYASAAVSGDPTAQFEYAKLLMHGTGVQQDMAAAYAWFEEAASNGVTAASDYLTFAHQHAAR